MNPAQCLALHLLDELDSGCLTVAKIPSVHGGYVRVPTSINAPWYSAFCKEYMTTRRRYPKPRTLIRRCHARKALERIIAGTTEGVYIERLLEFMERWRHTVKWDKRKEPEFEEVYGEF